MSDEGVGGNLVDFVWWFQGHHKDHIELSWLAFQPICSRNLALQPFQSFLVLAICLKLIVFVRAPMLFKTADLTERVFPAIFSINALWSCNPQQHLSISIVAQHSFLFSPCKATNRTFGNSFVILGYLNMFPQTRFLNFPEMYILKNEDQSILNLRG